MVLCKQKATVLYIYIYIYIYTHIEILSYMKYRNFSAIVELTKQLGKLFVKISSRLSADCFIIC